ncbi:hypothetical protein CRG98_025198 [Punica granatum]|uniref:Pentatricopeptide repeat-containing protein At1g09680 n=1 Tax=Punica granatum TaxID=22663 RepID=A0A2I0JDT8_PUNGR|nr:hypothetical protein CRG98_025198 [Punica granatum]
MSSPMASRASASLGAGALSHNNFKSWCSTNFVFYTTWYGPPSPAHQHQEEDPATLSALSEAIKTSFSVAEADPLLALPSPSYSHSHSLLKLLPSLTPHHIIDLINLNPHNLPPFSLLSFLNYLSSSSHPTVRLSPLTYCTMAHSLSSHLMFPHAQSLLNFLVSRKGNNSASSLFHSLLRSRPRSPSSPPRSAFVFEALIVAYTDFGLLPDAIQSFRLSKKHNLPIPFRACRHLLDRMLKTSSPEAASEFHKEILDSGYPPSVYSFNLLMHRFCKVGKTKNAQILFDGMAEWGLAPTAVSFNTLISGYCRAGDLEEALRLKGVMEERGVCPDVFTFTGLISGMCKESRLDDANQLFQEMRDRDLAPSDVTFTALIDGHCKNGRIPFALDIYQQMLRAGLGPDLVTYNTLINGHCRAGDLKSARKLVGEMIVMGLKPDKITYTTLIDGCCREGDIESALKYGQQMVGEGIEFDHVAFTALISGLCREGQIVDAERTLREMLKAGIEPDNATYTMVIDGFCKKGDSRMGMKILKEMQRDGHKPGVVTYNALMNGFCKQGQMKNAGMLLDAMLNVGVVPDDITYNILLEGQRKHGNSINFDKLIRNEKGVVQDYASYTALRGLHSKHLGLSLFCSLVAGAFPGMPNWSAPGMLLARLIGSLAPFLASLDWLVPLVFLGLDYWSNLVARLRDWFTEHEDLFLVYRGPCVTAEDFDRNFG